MLVYVILILFLSLDNRSPRLFTVKEDRGTIKRRLFKKRERKKERKEIMAVTKLLRRGSLI